MARPGGASASAAPEVSVIVLNRDGRHLLDDCLGSLAEHPAEAHVELMLADNGSRDGSPGYVRERFPEVTVLELGRNLGWPAANNVAIQAAHGRFLFLLNNDTVVRPGAIDALLAAARSDSRIGMVQPKLVYRDRPSVIQSAGILLLSDGSAGDRGSGESDAGQFDRRAEVFGANGAAMFLRREVVDDVGGFDPVFFSYYEEADLAWRMRLRGWRALYEPGAVVEHVHAATNIPASPRMRFHADRNRLLVVLKNAPWAFVWHSFRALGRRGLEAAPGSTPGRGPGHRLRVAASFCRHAPGALWRRRAIRRGRTVPDDDVLRWAVAREEWDRRPTASG